MPLPKDPRQRARRLDGIFGWMDKNRDGAWTREEFVSNFGHGSGKPLLIAVKPGGRGDVTESHLAWEHNRGIPEIPSPLYHAGRVYMVRSGGILTAVHADTGKAPTANASMPPVNTAPAPFSPTATSTSSASPDSSPWLRPATR